MVSSGCKDCMAAFLGLAKLLITTIMLNALLQTQYYIFYPWLAFLSIDLVLIIIFNLKYFKVLRDSNRLFNGDLFDIFAQIYPITIDIYCSLFIDIDQRKIENTTRVNNIILLVKALQNAGLGSLYGVLYFNMHSYLMIAAGSVHIADLLLIGVKFRSEFSYAYDFD